jgi:hypothetical protein
MGPTNTRLKRKLLAVTNPLVNYTATLITAVKIFIVQAPRLWPLLYIFKIFLKELEM